MQAVCLATASSLASGRVRWIKVTAVNEEAHLPSSWNLLLCPELGCCEWMASPKALLDQLFLFPEWSMIALQGLCKFTMETGHGPLHFTNREFGDTGRPLLLLHYSYTHSGLDSLLISLEVFSHFRKHGSITYFWQHNNGEVWRGQLKIN